MKKVLVSLVCLGMLTSGAFAQETTVETQSASANVKISCSNLDASSTIVLEIGQAEDGLPLEAYSVDGASKQDAVVQYLFEATQDGGLLGIVKTVEVTEAGRVHGSSILQLTQQGLLLQNVSFNVDAENIDETVKQEIYACTLPDVEAANASVEKK